MPCLFGLVNLQSSKYTNKRFDAKIYNSQRYRSMLSFKSFSCLVNTCKTIY